MKEYTKIVDFKYCGAAYTMFIDNKDRYFFMKRDINDNYYYTTYEEQKKLLSVFYNVRNVMNIKSGLENAINELPKIYVQRRKDDKTFDVIYEDRDKILKGIANFVVKEQDFEAQVEEVIEIIKKIGE